MHRKPLKRICWRRLPEDQTRLRSFDLLPVSGILRLHFLTCPPGAFLVTSSEHAKPRPRSDLIYGLDDRPHLTATVFAALQHVLASFVGIITPTLIMGCLLYTSPSPRD